MSETTGDCVGFGVAIYSTFGAGRLRTDKDLGWDKTGPERTVADSEVSWDRWGLCGTGPRHSSLSYDTSEDL